MRIYLILSTCVLIGFNASSQEEKPFHFYYASLFDTTLTDSSFLEVLLPFYEELGRKGVLKESENIGESYEYYTVLYEDSLELNSGRTYIYEESAWERLLYMGNQVIHHEDLNRANQEFIELRAVDSTIEKKLQTPVIARSDSTFTIDEVIYNHPENIMVAFTIEYRANSFEIQFFRMNSLDKLTHADKKIVGVKNVRYSVINEED